MIHSLIFHYKLMDKMRYKKFLCFILLFSIISPIKATINQLEEYHSTEYIQFLKSSSEILNNDNNLKLEEFGLQHDCPTFNGYYKY